MNPYKIRYWHASEEEQEILHKLCLELHLLLHPGYIYTFDIGSQSKKVSACVHSKIIDIRLPRNRTIHIWSFRGGRGEVVDVLSHENLKQSWEMDIQSSRSKRFLIGNAKNLHTYGTFCHFFEEQELTVQRQKELKTAVLFALTTLTEIVAQSKIEFGIYLSDCPVSLDDY